MGRGWCTGALLVIALTSPAWTSPTPQHYLATHEEQEGPYRLSSDELHRLRMQYLKELEADVVDAVRVRGISETVQLEQKFQDEILSAAVETLTRDRGQPNKQAEDLQEIDNLVKRDKRAVEVLSTLLGSSSGNKLGGGGGEGDESGGSGSGSILNLLGPLLGSSSGGGTAGDGGDAGSGSGSILNILGPLLGSSSGGGGGGATGEGESAGGGSDSGSILNLLGPLLGSSSGTTADADGEGGGGSNLLGILSSLLGSSSGGGGSSSGGGDDAGGGGGGSDLFGISNSSGGNKGTAINGAKAGILQQKLQLFLRLKFAVFTKILNTLTGVLGSSSGAQETPIHELKYPS